MEMNSDNEDERHIPNGELYDEDDLDAPPEDSLDMDEPLEMEAVDGEGASADEEHFDITLAAAHSYMGSELQDVSGRNVLEPGWLGTVPTTLYHGCVFPGETVPLLLLDQADAATVNNTLKQDRLFALLCPDENGQAFSGYGVLCEVYAASSAAPARYKARALHRCRLTQHMSLRRQPFHNRMRHLEVVVLPEITLRDPLRPARLACLDAHRRGNRQQDRGVRSMDALVTPWPLFVYDIFDYGRMREIIKDYFKSLCLDRMVPEEPVSLSFWAARNLTLTARDRFALFTVDNTLLRLHMECNFISRTSVVCCGACRAELARREHVFAMSSDGVHSTYTNPGGHMHDIVTVTEAANTELTGAPSTEYSWFPGYSWHTALCARCGQHVGWRFDALRRNLRPARFYGLCRNYAAPQDAEPEPEPEAEEEALPGSAPRHISLLQFRLAW